MPAASCDLGRGSPVFAQVVELQNKLSEESKKADKMEFEYKRVKEKVDSLQKEKEVRICISAATGWLDELRPALRSLRSLELGAVRPHSQLFRTENMCRASSLLLCSE